jgi:hypothetical protein
MGALLRLRLEAAVNELSKTFMKLAVLPHPVSATLELERDEACSRTVWHTAAGEAVQCKRSGLRP